VLILLQIDNGLIVYSAVGMYKPPYQRSSSQGTVTRNFIIIDNLYH